MPDNTGDAFEVACYEPIVGFRGALLITELQIAENPSAFGCLASAAIETVARVVWKISARAVNHMTAKRAPLAKQKSLERPPEPARKYAGRCTLLRAS